MLKRRGNRLPGGCIPHSGSAICACRHDGRAIETKGHANDVTFMPEETDGLRGTGIPQPRRSIGASRQSGFTVGTKGHRQHWLLMRKAKRYSSGHLPEPALADIVPVREIPTASQDSLTIGADGDSIDRVVVRKASALRARGDIPHPRLLIQAARHHQFSVAAKSHGMELFMPYCSTMV